MNTKTTNKKMSYLDKIKNNKQKVYHRKKKIKENKAIPEINVVTVNGNKAPKDENVKEESDKQATISISITAPKKSEQNSLAASSDRSIKLKGDKKSQDQLFQIKKEEMKFDSDKELSDGGSNPKISVTKPQKTSHFAHKRKPSKSQRDTLKLVIENKPSARSQRGLKTPDSKKIIKK
jgi:hypothetical protein